MTSTTITAPAADELAEAERDFELADRVEELEDEIGRLRECQDLLIRVLGDLSRVLRREHEAKEPAEVTARITRWDAVDEASQRAALHWLAAFYPASFDAMAADAEQYMADAAGS